MSGTANSVAVATTSQLAADAAAEIAELGGNAVDCGIAAAMCSINTQPGVCALAGSAFVTIWDAAGQPITIDGNVAVPGQGLADGRPAIVEPVTIHYGGGIETLVGASSVAVPGTLAALHLACRRYGRLPWRELLQPTVRAANDGFPLAAACRYYLGYSSDCIYARSADGYAALHDADDMLLDAGDLVVVPHLADTLSTIADEGDRVFYEGELGKRVAEHVQSHGGLLTRKDLCNYRPEIRDSLMVDVGKWRIALNPPPAIGGANLAAMLLCFGTGPIARWDSGSLARLALTQQATMRYRQQELDLATDISGPALRMLELAKSGELISRWSSASTVHTSAVDANGLACSITASSGYGSGEMPSGTGLWLNNCLGELELNRAGLQIGPPGRRLPSNMAPGCARSADALLAFGSPGADRITTALHQFLVNFLQLGLDLGEAVAHPRLHLRIDGESRDLAVEPGIDMPDNGFSVTEFDELNMYFGGVVAALVDATTGFDAAADPRREGGIFIGPCGTSCGEDVG